MKDLKKKLYKLSVRLPSVFKEDWPILVLFLLSVIFFYPVILQNKIPLPTDALVGAHIPWTETSWEGYPAGVPIKNQEITDAISQFYPWKSLVAEHWKAGKIPLWNFYMFNGTPFLATLHSAALYPLNFVYLIAKDHVAWSSFVFLQIMLSGFFMYILLRSFKLRKEASFLGGLAFSFSGYMIAWLEFGTGGHAGLWLPLLLYFERKLVLSKRIIWFITIPLIFFFIFTAGDFQVPLYITLTYFLFGFYEIFVEENVSKERFKKMFAVVSAFLLGLLLSASQILPTIELFSKSVRVDDPYIAQYFYGLMDWGKILNFIWPDFFGNVVTRNYWGNYGYHEYLSYIGIIPLVFVVFSFFLKKGKLEKFFWLLLFFGLLLLFPTPLALIPYKYKIPGLGTSSASRIIFLVDFCLAVICAYGYDKWVRSKSRFILKILVYFLAVASGIFLGLIISILIMDKPITVPFPVLNNLKISLKNMIPQTLILILMLSIVWVSFRVIKTIKNRNLSKSVFIFSSLLIISMSILDTLRFAWKNTPFGPLRFLFPTTKAIDFLQSQEQPFRIAGGIPTNLFMPYRLYSAEGYDPIYPRRNSEWYSIVDWGHTDSLTGRYGIIHYFYSPFINYANVSYVVDYKKDVLRQINNDGHFYEGIEPPRFKEVYVDGRISIFENTESLPYIWLTNKYEVIKNSKDAVERLKSSHEQVLVLESDPGARFSDNTISYKTENIKRGQNEVSLNLSISDNSLLFLSESYYSGWRAFVDGQETQILRANYLFQSIVVPSGNHKIEFIYDPKSFKIGKNLSIATILALISLFLYEKFGKRSRTRILRGFLDKSYKND